jgi:hypothetical protein
VNFWERFLKSLETDGGKLLVILLMLFFLVLVSLLLVESNHTPQETGRTLLASAISSLLSLLYGYLAGKSKS